MALLPSSTMRRDIASAYLASAARIGSWVIVSAVVYRWLGAADFAFLVLVRSTIGILNYTTLGLGPAMIHRMAKAQGKSEIRNQNDESNPNAQMTKSEMPEVVLDYERVPVLTPAQVIYRNGVALSGIIGAVGLVLALLAAFWLPRLHEGNAGENWLDYAAFVYAMGIGTVIRLVSEAHGATLQVNDRLFLDNIFQFVADCVWMVIACTAAIEGSLREVGYAFFWSGASLLLLRGLKAQRIIGVRRYPRGTVQRTMMWQLLSFGIVLTLAQLADFLYAPTDYLLITWLIDPQTVAAYAPVVQIDAGLLLLVTGVAAVLLPKAALAHAAGEAEKIRSYYVRGTLGTAAVLLAGAAAVWALSPWIFRLWLGAAKTPEEATLMGMTQAILPLVLIHTVVGGSSAVGRSILLGMGKVRAFTVAVLVAGAANVLLSYIFVAYCGWGLKGIVAGTIVAVVGRCGVWMPWYVGRQLAGNRKAETRNPK